MLDHFHPRVMVGVPGMAAVDEVINYDVAIVGGGLAGLGAAYGLRDSGLKTCVIEASDRLGGRVYGRHWSEVGADIDYGGTWVLPSFKTTRALAQEFGIDFTSSPSVATPLLHLRSGVYEERTHAGVSRTKLSDSLQQLNAVITESDGPISAREALDRAAVSDDVRDWHVATQRYLAGAPLEQIDSRHLLLDLDDLADPDHYSDQFVGTTKTLVAALSAQHSAEVLTGEAVVEISEEAGRYVVRSQTGRSWTAARVVLALPINVLSDVNLSGLPAVSADNLGEIKHVGASRKDWLVLSGVQRHFRVFASEGAYGYFRSERMLDNGHVLAVGLTASDEARSDLDDIERSIQRYLPSAQIVAHDTYDWVGSPFARGTWMVPEIGYYDRMALLQRKGESVVLAPNLYLVGGDVSAEFPGTIEGALKTGIDAAEAILMVSAHG